MKRLHPLTPLAPLTAAVALCAALATAAHAQDDEPLLPQQFGAATVVNGGAGLDEAAAIKRMAGHYPLRIVFSQRNGDYEVADSLQVMRGGERVAEVPDAGPWLLVDLPPGRYTLRGDFGGRMEQREVTIGRGGQTVHWVRGGAQG
ncbi:MAG: hypothetical protein JNN18_12230 [Rubrivivax sp.]|jgi:hypothetical protein|nr:hypothetical protein [Rubrivivax sp.]